MSPVDERREASRLEPRRCAWCLRVLETRCGRFCGARCRQTAFRLRRRRGLEVAPGAQGLRFAYADPPYPGTAARYYSDQPTYAGEVDHAALLSLLQARRFDGWALSTSEKALRDLLPMCPPGTRTCPWVKPDPPSPMTYGLENCWEPVLIWGGRPRQPGVRDWLQALPARGGGDLPGRKPLAFCAWLFDLLGMVPGDHLDDMFPGSGVVGAAWREVSSTARATLGEVSPGASATAGVADAGETSRAAAERSEVLDDGRAS